MTDDGPAADSAMDMCVHQLVEAVAAAHPDRVAVVCGEQALTYAELNGRADQLASHLAGFAFDRPAAGLLLPRSAEFVVAALAVLKAGGNYVPLDPDYPADRLRFMLEAARCPVVVGTAELLGALPQGTGVRTVAVDASGGSRAVASGTGPAVPAHPDTLAYTMFTSGSTGAPKGVMITHRGVVRLVRPPGIVRMDASDVVLHASSTSFDAATFDIWGALANGARLVVAPAGRISALDMGTLIRTHRVTTVLLPTGMFHLMVDERLPDLARLRQLVVGGDVLSSPHAQRFVRAVPDCLLVNAYGPTEVTVATTVHTVAPDHGDPGGVPIGRAMERTRVRLLDEELRPVPAGTTGQLYAGGPGLARGYLGDPALTAQRFVPDPWLPGARLYATGDQARLRPDGTLEFLGRMDDQFKKRGFRVEPGEVEAALRADPAVRDAVVLADGATADTRRLVAAVLPASADSGAVLDGVRSRLRATLPDYLVPDLWAVLDAFPLTPNGKVDRRELLRIAVTSPVRHEEAGEAESAEESALAAIWRDILRLDRVGPRDDFFDLGGHSLLANKVVAQVRRRLDVELSLDAVFDHPTIAELAEVIRAARVAASAP